MSKTFIYVDTLQVRINEEKNGVSPPIVVTGGGNLEAPRAGCRVKINGPCEIVYDKKGYEKFGAKVVVVTESEVEIEREYTGVDRSRD